MPRPSGPARFTRAALFSLAFVWSCVIPGFQVAHAQPAITTDHDAIRRVLADTALVHDLPGHLSPTRLQVDFNVTRAEREAMVPQLDRVSALLRSLPAVARNLGMTLDFRSNLGVSGDRHHRLLSGDVSMQSWPYGVLEGRLAYYAAKTVDFRVNPTLCAADEKVYGAGFRLAPHIDGSFHGYPLLDSVVVITHRTAPPCLPVSREQLLVTLRRTLDGILTQLPPGSEMHARASALDALLADMSPAERASDAYLSANRCDQVVCFAAPDTEGAEQIVVPNPDFYDWSRPTDVQALTLPLAELLAPSNPRHQFQERFITEVLATLDWPALGALVR